MENYSSAGGKSCFFHINPSNFSSCCNRYFGDIRLKIYKLPIFNPGGGVTPIHYLYGYVLPNRVVILKLLIQNGVSISQAFSRTGYNISNARKHQFCKQPFEIIQDRLLLKIWFSALTSRLLYSCCTLEWNIKNWTISRMGYQFQGEFQNGV